MKLRASLALVIIALIAPLAGAQLVAAPERCIQIYPDAVICFIDAFVVDAYGDVERAAGAVASLAEWQRRQAFVLTTNDPTRRALLVYPWDFTRGPLPEVAREGYVAEAFEDASAARRRLELLSWEERAQSYLLPVPDQSQAALVVYRRFPPRCGGAW